MGSFILNPGSFAKILETAGPSVETLEYLASGLTERVEKSRAMAEFSDLIKEVKTLVDNAVFQESNLTKIDIWSGARGLADKLHAAFSGTELSAFQDFIASKLASKVPVEQVTLDCAIDDKAGFVRAYSSNGKLLEGEALDAMDMLFNAYLAQPGNNMIMQDGVIYSGTNSGEVITDETDQAVKQRVSKIRDMLADPVKGFQRYLQDKKPGAHVTVIQHEAEQEEQPAFS